MPIDLYYLPLSPPCRNVTLAAKAIGIELNLKRTNVRAGETKTPEYLKMNPQHNIPTLDDNGFVLNESRAIMTYLADQYGEDDTYYPKDPKRRAKVNQMLYFDMGTLYQRLAELYFQEPKGDPEKLKKFEEALGFLDGFLEKTAFVAGDSLTLADLSTVATISSIEAIGHDISSYKNINKWYEIVKETAPGYKEVNEPGIAELKEFIEKAKAGK